MIIRQGDSASAILERFTDNTVALKFNWREAAAERFPDQKFDQAADFYVRVGQAVADVTVDVEPINLVVSEADVDPAVLATAAAAYQATEGALDGALRMVGYTLGRGAYVADGGGVGTQNLEALLLTLDHQQIIDETK